MQSQTQSQVPPSVQTFQDKYKVRFKHTGHDYILKGQTGLISTLYGRLYLGAVWVDWKYISELRQLGFTQMMEGRLRDWYFPPTLSASAVSLALQIISKTPSQKTRQAILKELKDAQ